ncbi:MAG: dihydroorotase [Flavisolibacter sp.]
MDILLRQVLIIDPSSPFHQQKVDIFIQNGIIAEIGALSHTPDKVVMEPGLCACPGWIDIFSNFCDPGFEFRETLESGSKAAAGGGYTDVFVTPNTYPVLDNKSAIEYIMTGSKNLPVNIFPLGAITKNTGGKELAEMYDMHASGAVAFSDGILPIQSSGILLKALQYIKAVDKTIIQLPDDRSISGLGVMNEGIVSTQLGLPGMPALAEELIIARDISLVEYTGSKIHFTGVSTSGSVGLIRKAKEKGLSVSCSVTPYHLFFTEEDLLDYDTNLKVNPPLRTKSDQKALKEAVESGVIDCIASHHQPHQTDHKILEFAYADFGMIGLETSFTMLLTSIPHLKLEQVVQLLCSKPRQLFNLPVPSINTRQRACITLFEPHKKWTFDHTHSQSKNSPLLGKFLTGKPLGIINKDNLFLNQ